MPDISPVLGFRLNTQALRLPLAMLNVTVPTPPRKAMDWLYEEPLIPSGSAVVVMISVSDGVLLPVFADCAPTTELTAGLGAVTASAISAAILRGEVTP